jgi:hypothetical protein
MRLRYSVSFESDTQPVQTVGGEVVAAEAPGAARRALKEASTRRPNPRQHWRSVVVVLEKLGAEESDDGAAETSVPPEEPSTG